MSTVAGSLQLLSAASIGVYAGAMLTGGRLRTRLRSCKLPTGRQQAHSPRPADAPRVPRTVVQCVTRTEGQMDVISKWAQFVGRVALGLIVFAKGAGAFSIDAIGARARSNPLGAAAAR